MDFRCLDFRVLATPVPCREVLALALAFHLLLGRLNLIFISRLHVDAKLDFAADLRFSNPAWREYRLSPVGTAL